MPGIESRRMGIRKMYRRFEAFDFTLIKCIKGVATFFMLNKVARFLREVFEPTVSGAAMALAWLLLDKFRHSIGAPELFRHAMDSALEHAKPYAFFIGLLFISGYLASMGSLLSSLARIVVLPLARLSHHASMFALGTFWTLSILEILVNPDASTLRGIFLLTVLLGGWGVCSAIIVYIFESKLSDRLGVKYQSARLLYLITSTLLLFIAVRGLEQLNMQDATAAKEVAQKPLSNHH
jgi:hypothetical protein